MPIHAAELRAKEIAPMIFTGSLQAAKAKATQAMNRRVLGYKQAPEDIILDHYGLIYTRPLIRKGDTPSGDPGPS
jgi:hypothetical protein